MKTNFSPDNLESDLCWHTFSLPSSCQGRDAVLPAGGTDNALPRALSRSRTACARTSTATFRSFAFLPEKDLSSADTTTWGHGKSCQDPSRLGFISSENGYHYLVEDLHAVSLHLKKRYPDLPLFLFGHSMGSMIARAVPFQIRFPLAGRGAACGDRRDPIPPRAQVWRCAGTSSPPRARCTAPLAFIR